MTQVYVIAASPHGPCKIGIAVNPHQRVVELQTGSYVALRVWARIRCADAAQVEYLAHSALADWRLSGEWFAVDVFGAVGVISDVLGGRFKMPSYVFQRVSPQTGRALKFDRNAYQRDYMRDKRLADKLGITVAAYRVKMSEGRKARP